MICPNTACGATVPQSARFCPECGKRLGDSDNGANQNVDTGGGDISGGVFQAGGDIHLGGEPQEARATYEPKWSWRSPLTLAVLTWISVISGLLSLGSVYKVVEPLVSTILGMDGAGNLKPVQPVWAFVFLGLVVVFALAMFLRRVARNETQHFPSLSWLPALTGWGRRIGLARMQGTCPFDGGRLRFYDKPVQWVDDLNTGKRKVTQQRMAAECVKNDEHWWPVDKTDGGDQ